MFTIPKFYTFLSFTKVLLTSNVLISSRGYFLLANFFPTLGSTQFSLSKTYLEETNCQEKICPLISAV